MLRFGISRIRLGYCVLLCIFKVLSGKSMRPSKFGRVRNHSVFTGKRQKFDFENKLLCSYSQNFQLLKHVQHGILWWYLNNTCYILYSSHLSTCLWIEIVKISYSTNISAWQHVRTCKLQVSGLIHTLTGFVYILHNGVSPKPIAV